MANFLTKILTSGLGEFADKVAGIVDRFKLTDDEKAQLSLEMEKLAMQQASELEQTMRAELGAKERILVAELQQGDTFTKRARPTVVYFGLAVVAFNYCLVPLVLWGAQAVSGHPLEGLPEFKLPAEFWYGWAGIVATYSVGRSMEKRGASNNIVEVITGNKARDSLADKATFKSILD